jgi:hypothetical protein
LIFDIPMRRIWTNALLACYCLLLFLAFDLAYSNFVYVEARDRSPRMMDARYSHGLAANFSGFESWGGSRYPFFTNSLAFRDGQVRAMPLRSSTYLILLLGDSFTEAVGVPFEQSFAGMLFHAGQQGNRVEFLNAGVASYSPTLYYSKTKPIAGDVHFSAEGNRFVFDNVANRLLTIQAERPAAGEDGSPRKLQ